jgi:aminopeptidase N
MNCRSTHRIPARLPVGGLRVLALLATVAAFGSAPARTDGAVHLTHDLAVRLDPVSREFQAEDTIRLHASGLVEFALSDRLRVEHLSLDGTPQKVVPRPGGGHLTRYRIALGPGVRSHTVAVRSGGTLAVLPEADAREVLGGLPAMASSRGSFLPAGGGWYPDFGEIPFSFLLRLDLPADQRGLVPGRLVSEEVRGGRYRAAFAFPDAAEGITLIAGPYQVREQWLRGTHGKSVRLRTYFHPEIAGLAAEYLSAAEGFFELYGRWIGPYPYGEFSIVSSPLPTGFGMPTLTYLGVDVLRLPFIRASSLGHEILHNWWGNGVYVDYDQGNWSEALTTFMADYTYKEREGSDAAREMRVSWLRDFAAVPPGRDTPLAQFTARTHGTSQVVGYDKGAFLFLMLRDRIGAEGFDAALRLFWRDWRFRRASWADLRRAFEQSTQRDLSGFFAQWLLRRGAPRVWIEQAKVERASSTYRVSITLSQEGPPYALRVPIVLTTEAGREDRQLEFEGPRQEHTLELGSRPRTLTLDPEYRLFRQLDPGEAPPILRQVMLDPATVTIVATPDEKVREAGMELARLLQDTPPKMGEADSLPGGAPLLVIGLSGDVDALLRRSGLPARPAALQGKGTAQVWVDYQGSGKVMGVVSVESPEALRNLLRPLPHYGRQGYLIFEGAQATLRGVWPTKSPVWQFPPVE